MRFIDSHCHLDSPRIPEAERSRMLRAAGKAGLTDIVIPGVLPDTWQRIQDLARHPETGSASSPLPHLYPCAGIHPQALPDLDDNAVADALAQLEAFPSESLVAIGETGLDKPTSKARGGALERQMEVLDAHLDIAVRAGLPVILHCFRCHETLLHLLRRRANLPPELILHSFSGSAEMIPRYLAFRAWFSFAGPVTYPNARRPLAALKATPLDRLLLETDAPDQTPVPHRGSLNEPAFLPDIANRVAEILELPLSEIAARTTQNAQTCYHLDTWTHNRGSSRDSNDGAHTAREVAR